MTKEEVSQYIASNFEGKLTPVETGRFDPWFEVKAEDIRWALRSVEDLIGQTDDEDIFDQVFSGFCIGK